MDSASESLQEPICATKPRGTTWDASGWKDYCDIGFGDV